MAGASIWVILTLLLQHHQTYGSNQENNDSLITRIQEEKFLFCHLIQECPHHSQYLPLLTRYCKNFYNKSPNLSIQVPCLTASSTGSNFEKPYSTYDKILNYFWHNNNKFSTNLPSSGSAPIPITMEKNYNICKLKIPSTLVATPEKSTGENSKINNLPLNFFGPLFNQESGTKNKPNGFAGGTVTGKPFSAEYSQYLNPQLFSPYVSSLNQGGVNINDPQNIKPSNLFTSTVAVKPYPSYQSSQNNYPNLKNIDGSNTNLKTGTLVSGATITKPYTSVPNYLIYDSIRNQGVTNPKFYTAVYSPRVPKDQRVNSKSNFPTTHTIKHLQNTRDMRNIYTLNGIDLKKCQFVPATVADGKPHIFYNGLPYRIVCIRQESNKMFSTKPVGSIGTTAKPNLSTVNYFLSSTNPIYKTPYDSLGQTGYYGNNGVIVDGSAAMKPYTENGYWKTTNYVSTRKPQLLDVNNWGKLSREKTVYPETSGNNPSSDASSTNNVVEANQKISSNGGLCSAFKINDLICNGNSEDLKSLLVNLICKLQTVTCNRNNVKLLGQNRN